MPSAHDEYRTDADLATAIAELSAGATLLDAWAGLPDQGTCIRALSTQQRVLRIFREPRRPRLKSGAFAVDWEDLLLDDYRAHHPQALSVRLLELGLVHHNPPYSNPAQRLALARITHFAERGLWQVALVPSSTGTAAFQSAYRAASQVCFLAGRRTFLEPIARGKNRGTLRRAQGPARFDSALLHFCDHDPGRMERFVAIFDRFGIVQELRHKQGRPSAGKGGVLHLLTSKSRLLSTAPLERSPVRIRGKKRLSKASLAEGIDSRTGARSSGAKQ